MDKNIKQLSASVFKPLYTFRIYVVFVMIVENLVAIFQPYLMGKLIDSLKKPMDEIFCLAGVVLLFVVMDFFLNWYQNYIWFKMLYRGTNLMRSAVMEKVMGNSFTFFIQNKSGDIVNKIMNDSSQYAQRILFATPILLLNIFSLILAFTMIFFMDGWIGAALLIVCIAYFFSYRNINIQLRNRGQQEKETYSELLHQTNKLYDGIPTIKLFLKEKEFAESYRNTAKRLSDRSVKLQRYKSLAQSLSSMIINIMPVVTVVLGVWFVVQEKCTLGAVFSIYSYISLLGEPIRNLTDYNLTMQEGSVNEERLNQMLYTNNQNTSEECTEPNEQRKKTISKINKISFENMNYAYEGQQPVFEQFNMDIKLNDKIAVVGRSGSGKSTLIRLLTGQIYPTEGKICVNDTDLKNIDERSFLSRIAIMPQDIFLYEDNVMENILFGRECEKKKMQWIIDALDVKSFADRTEKNLSGGERRRIGLARALAGDFDLLILDEPTSDVDEVTEKKMISFINEFLKSGDKMLLVITHRPAILKICTETRILQDKL